MMLLDTDYYLLTVPPIALCLWARWRLLSACRAAGKFPSSSGMTGADIARVVMRGGPLGPVEIEPASGQLADHYDTGTKVLRLSTGVESGRSLAALGIAAHEAGHVLQHGARDPSLRLRSLVVPAAALGSMLFWQLFLAGFLLGIFRLIIWSVYVLWLSVLLQLINVPVELNASRRARKAILAVGPVAPEEEAMLGRVLKSAAWIRVADVLTAAWSPLRRLLGSSFPDRP